MKGLNIIKEYRLKKKMTQIEFDARQPDIDALKNELEACYSKRREGIARSNGVEKVN